MLKRFGGAYPREARPIPPDEAPKWCRIDLLAFGLCVATVLCACGANNNSSDNSPRLEARSSVPTPYEDRELRQLIREGDLSTRIELATWLLVSHPSNDELTREALECAGSTDDCLRDELRRLAGRLRSQDPRKALLAALSGARHLRDEPVLNALAPLFAEGGRSATLAAFVAGILSIEVASASAAAPSSQAGWIWMTRSPRTCSFLAGDTIRAGEEGMEALFRERECALPCVGEEAACADVGGLDSIGGTAALGSDPVLALGLGNLLFIRRMLGHLANATDRFALTLRLARFQERAEESLRRLELPIRLPVDVSPPSFANRHIIEMDLHPSDDGFIVSSFESDDLILALSPARASYGHAPVLGWLDGRPSVRHGPQGRDWTHRSIADQNGGLNEEAMREVLESLSPAQDGQRRSIEVRFDEAVQPRLVVELANLCASLSPPLGWHWVFAGPRGATRIDVPPGTHLPDRRDRTIRELARRVLASAREASARDAGLDDIPLDDME